MIEHYIKREYRKQIIGATFLYQLIALKSC